MTDKKPAKKARTHEANYKACRRDANMLWVAGVVAVIGVAFFKVSIWLRTPDEKIVHIVNHKTKKVYVDKSPNRSVHSYQVSK